MPTKAKAKPRRKAAGRKSATRRPAAKARTQNSDLKQIVTMLEDDHSKVDKLFKRYDKMKDAEDKARFKLAGEICTMLKVHTTIEEELFYPRARDVLDEEDDLIDEAEVEHGSVKQLIADVEQMETDDHLYDAKVKVMGEFVKHHADEEEDELFPKLKKKAKDQFDGVFAQMKEMREALETDLGAGGKKQRGTRTRTASSERKSAALS
jgi:hemerythrin superfamily protein